MARTLPNFDPDLGPSVSNLADLGRIVRNRRAQGRLRIDDAAALSGISGDLLSRLENGKPVTADKLLLVLDALGLRVLVVPAESADALLAAASDTSPDPDRARHD